MGEMTQVVGVVVVGFVLVFGIAYGVPMWFKGGPFEGRIGKPVGDRDESSRSKKGKRK
jgi:hypothetical protein